MYESIRCPLRVISCRERRGSHLKVLHGCPNIVKTVVLAQGPGYASQKTYPLQQQQDQEANTFSACFTQHQALLGLQRVEVQARRGTARITLLADKGSMINLIRRDMVTTLGLGTGTPWQLHLQVVGSHYRGIPSSLHNISFLDSKGAAHIITAVTVSSITVCARSPGLAPIKHFFPKANPEVYDWQRGTSTS